MRYKLPGRPEVIEREQDGVDQRGLGRSRAYCSAVCPFRVARQQSSGRPLSQSIILLATLSQPGSSMISWAIPLNISDSAL